MKLLKLIPAATIALTVFMPLEGKTEEICMYNNAAFAIDKMIITASSGASKDTGSFTVGMTKCIKLGDVPVPLNTGYKVQYTIQAGSCVTYDRYTKCLCDDYLLHSSSGEGKTYTYEVTGVTTESKCKLK
tara:strand:+ start:220 stop:609 length:390 start_codon:yes stop_codon:yes gene_type:complete